MAINENVMQTMGQLILSCVNNEMDFYFHCQVMQSSNVANKLLNCIEFQMIDLGGQDLNTIRTLYKLFSKGIIQSDQIFENYVDRN